MVAAWAERTPDDFVFTAKMPKLITHELRLRNCRRELDAFLGSLRPMGEKLGAVLIQFSPGFRPVHDEDALTEFLDLLPTGKISFAVEFRHPDWHAPRIAKLLTEHGVSCAWNDLTALDAQNEGAFGFLPITADFLYVRLMGDLETKFRPDGERQFRYGSLLWERASGMEFWAERLRKHLADTRRIYVMVNNHYEGFLADDLPAAGAAAGIEIELPSLVQHMPKPGEAPQGAGRATRPALIGRIEVDGVLRTALVPLAAQLPV